MRKKNWNISQTFTELFQFCLLKFGFQYRKNIFIIINEYLIRNYKYLFNVWNYQHYIALLQLQKEV